MQHTQPSPPTSPPGERTDFVPLNSNNPFGGIKEEARLSFKSFFLNVIYPLAPEANKSFTVNFFFQNWIRNITREKEK